MELHMGGLGQQQQQQQQQQQEGRRMEAPSWPIIIIITSYTCNIDSPLESCLPLESVLSLPILKF
jgi:hypothetical protein